MNELDGKVLRQHRTKKAAVAAGRAAAKQLGVELLIHRTDGVSSEKNSYGNDPCPPRDGG